jgi:VWFA-related protein
MSRMPLVAAPLALLLLAEAPRPSNRDAAPEHAVVELVLIEAYVTDNRGRPLTGLEAGDFNLLVDGRAKPITSVEYREAIVDAAAAGPSGTRGPEESPGRPPSGPGVPRRFVLLFDDATSAPQGLLAARNAAEKLVSERFVGNDQIALAVYDRSLHILNDFTTDRESLRRAIERSLTNRRLSTFAHDLEDRQQELQRLAGLTPGDLSLRQATLAVATYASEELVILRGVLNALRTLVDALAGWPGYKAILFMGDGIPENPAQLYMDQLPALAARLDETSRLERYNLAQEIKDLTYAAAAAGVTIHTVQTSGVAAGRGSEMRAASRRSNSLETIAMNTGGLSSSSNDLLKALTEAEAGSRAYYVLGYTPEGPPDGLYHTVQVRVKKSGARIRWRRGFTRLLPEAARERAIQAAYVIPEFHSELGVDLSAVTGPAGASARVTDLVLHLPPNRVLFLPSEGRPTARLEVGLVVLEDSGRETLRVARKVQIALGPDIQNRSVVGLNFFCRVKLPSSAQSITAVVSDLAAGAVGAARLPLPATTDAGDRAILGLSIYSLEEQSAWVQIDPAADAGEARASYTIGPALKRTFAPGERAACGFKRPAGAPSESASLKLLIRKNGQDLKILDVPPPAGGPHEAMKTLLPLEGLSAGDYELVVQESSSGQTVERGRVSFSISAERSPITGDGAGVPGA